MHRDLIGFDFRNALVLGNLCEYRNQ